MSNQAMREQVVRSLLGKGAHVEFGQVIADIPTAMRGAVPDGAAHSPWDILEHMRIAQWDILEFSRETSHVSPAWPDGYWPQSHMPPSADAWGASAAAFESDLSEMIHLVSDPSTDLLTPFAHGDGQTLLREALLIADHNAYHLGELVVVRRLLGIWQ